MPSQLPQDGAGNVYDVTANYLVTKPSTRFTTRQLTFFDVRVDGCQTSPYVSNSLYSRAVRGIQVAAEIYTVGEPSSDHFMVVVASDTAADPHSNSFDGDSTEGGSGYNAMAQSLQTAIGSICQGVTPKFLLGSGFSTGRLNYSDESQNDD
jgi:hypothetical protein